MEQLRLSAETGCPHNRPFRQLLQTAIFQRYKSVPRILSRRHCRQFQSIGNYSSHVLQRMNGYICFFLKKQFFQFLDKKPFSPDFKKRSIQNLIAFRRHRKQLHLYFRISIFNPFLHIFCLPKCQQTFSRGDYNLIFQQPSPFPYQD